MSMWHRLYYAFNRWRYGNDYGCGRCHHPHWDHDKTGCLITGCPCTIYSVERVSHD